MDILQLIKSRRSIGRVKPDPVDRSLIEQLLEAATWAPNHYRTEPWRFIVLTGEGRRLLAQAYSEIARAALDDPNPEFLKKQEAKAYRAPVIIVAAASLSDHPNAVEMEEKGAVYASVQNMLLTAHAFGLGAMWRTGKDAYDPRMKERLGLGERETVVGFLYIGYPDVNPPSPSREPIAAKTIWIDR